MQHLDKTRVVSAVTSVFDFPKSILRGCTCTKAFAELLFSLDSAVSHRPRLWNLPRLKRIDFPSSNQSDLFLGGPSSPDKPTFHNINNVNVITGPPFVSSFLLRVTVETLRHHNYRGLQTVMLDRKKQPPGVPGPAGQHNICIVYQVQEMCVYQNVYSQRALPRCNHGYQVLCLPMGPYLMKTEKEVLQVFHHICLEIVFSFSCSMSGFN